MADLVVRRLLIDLDSPVARHWFGGDALRTALFNALSMSFPMGEAQGFVGQEATHRRLHGLFNVQLEKHGLTNDWEPRARERLKFLNDFHPRHWLAITAATEHFTAIFADWTLRNPQWFDGSEERLKTLWLWHSAEDSEHKSSAFDLFRALGGTDASRIKCFKRLTFIFWSDILRQTVNNLHRDGTLLKWRNWLQNHTEVYSIMGANQAVAQ